MKKILLVSSLLAAGLALGCKPSGEKPAGQSSGTAAQQLDKAEAATKEAVHEMKEYTFAQKSEFVAAMRAKLADLNRNLDELSAKIEKSGAEAKAAAKPKLAELREQAARLGKQLADVIDATPSTWTAIKAESEKAYDGLKDGLMRSRQWVSDKIAP